MECPTTVLNPNQRKQQKYSTRRGDHWPICVHFPLPFLYGYASFRGPYSNNSLIDQLEERNPSWIALPCLKRFMKNRPWNSCFVLRKQWTLSFSIINKWGRRGEVLTCEWGKAFFYNTSYPILVDDCVLFQLFTSFSCHCGETRWERELFSISRQTPSRGWNNSLFCCWFLLSYLE